MLHVIKNNVDLLSPMMTSIVNPYLSKEEFQSHLKLSHVRPRLKKDDPYKKILKNYWPVINSGAPREAPRVGGAHS